MEIIFSLLIFLIPEDFGLFIKFDKLFTSISKGFTCTQKQKSIRPQGELKHGKNTLLKVGIQVDQKIATTDQIDSVKWWILHQIMGRKNDHFPNFFGDGIAFPLRNKIET